ncbi:MAG: glycosyltransferase family 9 protein [Bacteroidales bacterium]|nr:glycosyltransferase family 9 protein [Bacteroidales bacterium]
MKKILVIQTASIGDVILMTSVLEKLNQKHPESKIDILIKKENASLFTLHPFISSLLLLDKKENKYKNILKLIFQIRDEKYDLIVNLQRFFSSGMITVFSGSKQTRGFKKNPLSLFFSKRFHHSISPHSKLHEIDRNQKLIEDITDSTPAKCKLYPSQHDYAKTSEFKTQKYICIAPGSLWQTKQFPKENWIAFASQIKTDTLIYYIGGKNEFELSEEIRRDSKHQNSINLCGKFTLLETTALMEHAYMNFTNDSAPLHLASSVNAPVAAIFCSTVPEFGFGPLSEHSHIIQTEKELKCRPCGLHGFTSCPEKHFNCGHTIDIQKLLTIIQ